jgi:predicted Zn-dependent protease
MLQLMGKSVEAVTIYCNSLSLAPNTATCDHIQGLIATCRGDIPEAIRVFMAATALEPKQPIHWLALGQVQMEMGQVEEALQSFDRILSLQPDDLVALIYSHDGLVAIADFDLAQQRLEKARTIAPKDYQVIKRLIEHRLRIKLVGDEAGKQTLKMIKSTLKLFPDSPDIHVLLANFYVLRGEKEKGVKLLYEFTQNHPNHPLGWYYYALCLRKVGTIQESVEAIVRADQLLPENKSILHLKLEVLRLAGKDKE